MANALLESTWKKVLKDNPTVDDSGLADALKAYGKAEGKDVDEQLDALDEIVSQAEKIKKQNAKSRNKEVSKYLEEVLSEAEQRQRRLEDEDEAEVGMLDDEKSYGAYLKKSLVRLVKKPLYFAAAVGSKPEEHRIIFHKAQDGKKLLKSIKEAVRSSKYAWGLAGGHAEQEGTLTLALEGPQIGGLKKKLEQLLKYFKPLPFDTILLMVDGEQADDLPDADEGASSRAPAGPPMPPVDSETLRFAQRLKAMKGDFEKVISGGGANGSELQALYAQAAQALKGKDFDTAHATLDRLTPLIERGLRDLTEGATSVDDPTKLFTQRLKKLSAAIKQAAGTPTGDEARLKASEAGVLAKRKDYAGANRLLDEVESRLSSGSPSGFVEADFRRTMTAAQSTWRESIEVIDEQLNQIRSALQAIGTPAMLALADRGLPAVTGNHKTAVMVALKEIDIATGDKLPDAASKALTAIAAFRRHVLSDPRVTTLDADSADAFGVKVAVGANISRGLDALESALSKVTK